MPFKVCPFCDESQSYRFVTESEHMRLIYPKNPAIPFHILVVPKKHIETLDELPEAYFVEFARLLKELVGHVHKQLGKDYLGYNLLSNNGSEAVNQRVKHTHLHVFLRSRQDGIDPITDHAHQDPQDFTPKQREDLQIIKTWYTQSGQNQA